MTNIREFHTNPGSFGAGASGLEEDVSSTMNVNSADTEVGITLFEVTGVDYEFSTLPENMFILLFLAPFLPSLLKRLKMKALIWKKVV